MIDECAVLFVAPSIVAHNGPSKLQRSSTCIQCQEASTEFSSKLSHFPTDEAKWRHVWEHARTTYNVATEPNPSIEAIKDNGQCKAFFHEKCFPLKKAPQPQKQRKRSSTAEAIEHVDTYSKAKRLSHPLQRPLLQPNSSKFAEDGGNYLRTNGNNAIVRRCEACDREIEQTAEIRDRHVWHHLNKPRETANGQIQPPLPRFRCGLRTGRHGLICEWGTYIMVHMETHWHEQHSHIAIAIDMPPVLDLSTSLRQPFEQMKLICFPPAMRCLERPNQSASALQPAIAAISQQALADDDDEVIAVEEDQLDAEPFQMSVDDRPSVYSRAAAARSCKECEVDYFDVAEHCATRHAGVSPFLCGHDECSESFSSIFHFVKHVVVLHGKKPDNSSPISLIINKTQLKTLEDSITHCFGQLAFDDFCF